LLARKVVVFGMREMIRCRPFIVEDELGKPGPSQKERFAEYQFLGVRFVAVIIVPRRR
jgi:hypothetical protein